MYCSLFALATPSKVDVLLCCDRRALAAERRLAKLAASKSEAAGELRGTLRKGCFLLLLTAQRCRRPQLLQLTTSSHDDVVLRVSCLGCLCRATLVEANVSGQACVHVLRQHARVELRLAKRTTKSQLLNANVKSLLRQRRTHLYENAAMMLRASQPFKCNTRWPR